MSDKISSRASLIYLLETLWDYAADPKVPSAKRDFIEHFANDFIERFNIEFPLQDLGVSVSEAIKTKENIGG